MSDQFYEKMAATAVKLLRKFGTEVVFPRETGGEYDPVTGTTTDPVDASVASTGLMKPYPENMIDGTLIKRGDRMLILGPEVEPLTTDTPRMRDKALGQVVSITTTSPTGIPLVFFAQMRK